MRCERCEGLMIRAQHFAITVLQRKIWIWKCINCGNVLDHTIVMNRQHEWETNGHPTIGRDSLPRIHYLDKQVEEKPAA